MSKAVTPTADTSEEARGARRDTGHDLELVLAFLNTTDADAETDVLDDADQWRTWCLRHGLAEFHDLAAVRNVRDSLRAGVTHPGEDAPPAPGLATWPVRITLHDGVPVLGGSDAVGSVLAAAVHLVATDHWSRIKICPADDCLEAFYDRSRNRSRTWCSMRVCGNREKARSWRERHTTAEAAGT